MHLAASKTALTVRLSTDVGTNKKRRDVSVMSAAAKTLTFTMTQLKMKVNKQSWRWTGRQTETWRRSEPGGVAAHRGM